jgi:hypothetical protein
MECLIGLCRELCITAATCGVNSYATCEAIKKIAAELDSIDELQRLREVAWRKQQERFTQLSRKLDSNWFAEKRQ